ncbi:MAG: helix-turn-helix transcriptional regulator [Cyclobacteriaceae bacterium]|nr:helix-turn-helix transcriptional regulator [Cyclobacteriaceae bacterium]
MPENIKKKGVLSEIVQMLDPVTAKLQNEFQYKSYSEWARQYIRAFQKQPHLPGQMIYIMDYHSKEIILSKGFELNLGISEPLEISAIYQQIHQEDVYTVVKIVKGVVSYCLNIDVGEAFEMVLTHDYRLKCKNEKYRWFLRKSYAMSFSGKTFDLTLNILTDISCSKKDGPVTWSLEGPEKDFFYNEVKKELAYQPVKNDLLSKREMEILESLKKGESSENLAGKMNISMHTVNTHRRNILKKLKVRNASEMIYKAVQMGLL